MPPPTILAHKTDFLTSQTLQLSRAPAPSNAWRRRIAAASNNNDNDNGNDNDGDKNKNEDANPTPAPLLAEKAVDDALYRLNHVFLQHARRVYAPQATRHVAEQIEALYLEAGERGVRAAAAVDSDDDYDDEDGLAAVGGGGGGGGGGDIGGRRAGGVRRLRVGVDFTTDDAIASLPPTWDQHQHLRTAAAQAEAHPPEAQRYADLVARLAALSRRRAGVRERVARLRRMHDLLAPFRDTDGEGVGGAGGEENGFGDGGSGAAQGRNKVQPNLVTRNGELEKELERMRVLLVRVAGRVARLPPDGPGGKRNAKGKGRRRGAHEEDEEMADVQDLDLLERRKVERLLDGL